MVGTPGATKFHNFSESLAQSHAAEDLPLWEEIYKKAFPGMVAMCNHREDGPHQRAGIDRSIIMPNSKQILVDEKVRGRNKKTGKVYTDIALEYWSDIGRRKLGWVCKPLLADYIAYAIAPIGKCYLLPVVQLQQAWVKYGEQWKSEHYCIKAENMNNGIRWTTVSVGVPVSDLFRAMGECFRVSFTPVDIED